MFPSTLLISHSNRRLDNRFNIFEGLFQNWFFIGISAIMCGGQILIIFVGGKAFNIASPGQTGIMWGTAILLGFLSIPIGIVIRLIPDSLCEKLVPESLKRRARTKVPEFTISDDEERFTHYPAPFADVRDELTFMKKLKGGRINNLKFAMKHPRETFIAKYKSPSHSRSPSIKMPSPPSRENSFGSSGPSAAGNGGIAGSATPDSRKQSRSIRSRSNSALGAATLMTGLVAGSIGAAGWSPVERQGDWQQLPPPKTSPSPLGSTRGKDEETSGPSS